MRRAFTLADLSTSLVAVGLLLVLVLAGLSEQRRQAGLGEDIASLKRYASGTAGYVADHADLIWALSWQAEETYMILNLDGELEPIEAETTMQAKAFQAVDLIRRTGDRLGEAGMPLIEFGWIPMVYYSHLPLVSYMNEDPLSRWTHSVRDESRARWKDDPINKFDQGFWLPFQPDPARWNRRWPYGTGFQPVPATWDVHQSDLDDDFVGMRTQQAGTHDNWSIPGGAELGQRVMSDVLFPGNKVHMHDSHERHFGSQQQYFARVDAFESGRGHARVPVLMFDGSAGVRASSDANPGWRPNTPNWPCMMFWYQPSKWEPTSPMGDGDPSNLSDCMGFYRWTRGGLKGLDFGGRPLDTGQPDPGSCQLE